ncbi:hypothetical protein CKO15_09800 [Halorhodospira abdelmalekii]|nr:hypothetical protein [Halorhodospira abdelmalekii]
MAALSEAYSSLHQLYDEITEIAEDALIEGHRHFNAILSEERAARRQELKALIAENSALVEQGLCDYRAAQERGESAPQLMHNIIGTQHAIKNLREELLDLNGAELLEIRHDATLGGSTH